MSRHSTQPWGQPGVGPALLPSVSGSLSVRLLGPIFCGNVRLTGKEPEVQTSHASAPRCYPLVSFARGQFAKSGNEHESSAASSAEGLPQAWLF